MQNMRTKVRNRLTSAANWLERAGDDLTGIISTMAETDQITEVEKSRLNFLIERVRRRLLEHRNELRQAARELNGGTP